ncbi:MAG: hypothetical protein HPY64_07670 [Anaerolineae bacterium]|nr:hypothetical protein [Anaerolineae bacterium]
MKAPRCFAVFMVALTIFSATSPVLAQGLDQTLNWPEVGFAIRYPAGWGTQVPDEQTRILLSDPAFDVINSDAPPDSPAVIIAAFSSEMVGAIGSPQDVLNAFAGEFGVEVSTPLAITVAGFPALRINAAVPDFVGFSYDIVIITTNNYAYMVAAVAPTAQGFTSQFDSMLQSITISESSSGGPTSPTSGPTTSSPAQAVTTPVNAVRITLDQTLTNNWNEIDAAELVGTDASGAEIRQWAIRAEATSQYASSSWSAQQATGAPNTATCGDNSTAWASATATGQDALTVYYATPVIPTQINIYQTFNPGAIVLVEVLPADGSAPIPVFRGYDLTTACPGVLTVDVGATVEPVVPPGGGAPVDTVRITLDQALINNWNEIDAVELVGTDSSGTEIRQWAFRAEATSQYASSSWSAQQATGAPNTTGCGDYSTAWASATAAGRETLTVHYLVPVFPTQINIHQTFNPGAIVLVEALPIDGSAPIVVFSGRDTATACPGILSIQVQTAAAPGGEASLAYGDAVRGAINNATYSQDWTFMGNAGDVITITMQTVTGDLDPYLYLLDAAGNELAYNDDAEDTSIGQYNAQIARFTLPATGLYTIRATRFAEESGTSSGDYRLRLEAGGVAQPGGAPATIGGGSISIGQTVTGQINNTTYEQDWTFDGTAGDTVTVTMISTGGDLDPYLSLLDSAGMELVSNDDSVIPLRNSLDSQLSFILPATGRYVIRASRFAGSDGSSSGTYELTLSAGGPFSSSTPISINQTVTGEISNTSFGQVWSFEGQAGQVVVITMRATSGDLDSTLTLMDATGATLDYNDDAEDPAVGGYNAQIPRYTLPASGTYYIYAARYGGQSGSTSGLYELTLAQSK